MNQVKEIININLENEMDLILAHKRSMRLVELCNLSLPVQTLFATGVSEIARIAMGKKRDKAGKMSLNISYSIPSQKDIHAIIILNKEDFDVNEMAVAYAKKLVDELKTVAVKGKVEVHLRQRAMHGGLITEDKIKSFVDYFKKEPPLSAYDEIRKKNIQLIALSEKLKESESDYRKLTESLPLMMFTLNALGKITRTNNWFNNYFESPGKTLNGISWQTFLHGDDLRESLSKWERAQVDKQPLNIQARLKKKSENEEFIWHMINIAPLKDKSNNVVEWAGFFVDINAQKLVEETLKNNEELKKVQGELVQKNNELTRQKDFVETILDSSVDLISVYDTHMRIIAFNKKCEQIYGISREEIFGQHFTDVFPQAEGGQSHSDLQRAIKGEFIHNHIYTSPIVNCHYENFLIPLSDHSGTVYSVLIIAHDITANVKAEQQLKQANAELQKSNHDLEQFAYIASHDLQEPLRKIRNFSELLEDNFENKKLASHYLNKIDSAATRMSSLIKDVLNYSRIANTNDYVEEVDLNLILENVQVDFELVLEEKNATITLEKLPVIHGIKLQMHQLFYNIISNALKFCENNPLINITCKPVEPSLIVELELLEEKEYYSIEVRDNGIGFDQQYAQQIFTIFQRLNERQSFSGTGIGLALCKKIVTNHHGAIWANSKKNEGTSITVVLPLSQ